MIKNYLEGVESAVSKLLEVRKEFHNDINDIYKDSIPPMYLFNRQNTEQTIQLGEKNWSKKEHIVEGFKRSKKALIKLESEQFALSSIDGSLLQIAAKGIELFSKNKKNTTTLSLNAKTSKFCIGREIRGLPAGLIIYAGRNHYNHIEAGGDLHNPTKKIVETLNINSNLYKPYLQFNFEQSSNLPINRATEFVLLLTWETFEDFAYDLKGL